MLTVTNSGNILLFAPKAVREISEYFGVGRFDYPPNRVEQGGWLLGPYLSDQVGCVQGLVTHFLPARNAVGTPAYLDWPAIENVRLMRQFDKLQEQMALTDPEQAKKLRLLGWIHSHPNKLPVFLSGTDMENIHDNFNSPLQFSVVLNPHTQQWKAFLGPRAQEVPAVVLSSFLEESPALPLQNEPRKKCKKSTYGNPPGGKRKKHKKKKKNGKKGG